MFCQQCGAPIEDGNKFCKYCGTAVKAEKEELEDGCCEEGAECESCGNCDECEECERCDNCDECEECEECVCCENGEPCEDCDECEACVCCECDKCCEDFEDEEEYDEGLIRIPSKSRAIAVLLAIFLGGFGAHMFYLGRFRNGIIRLLFCWTVIPAAWALIEALGYIVMGKEAWMDLTGYYEVK